MAFLSRKALQKIGFASVGNDVYISDRASFYGVDRISIGNNVRIDDFCVLSAGAGGIEIGNYVHVAVATLLIGSGKILLRDFCNLSSRVSIYSSSDDYSGETMTNPMVPQEFKNVHTEGVTIGRHAIIGSGSVVLPGVNISDGVAIGALSLVKDNCVPFYIYAGNPAKRIKERDKNVLNLELKLAEKSRV